MLQYEFLVQMHKEEVEQRAREAWKFEKEVSAQKGIRHFFERLQTKKQTIGRDCGCACAPC